jgi:hypothetical protein
MNPYTNYYVNQAGSGLPGFQGIRYQRGDGFWSNSLLPFFKSLLPAIGKIGQKALPSAVGLASDIISGENVKRSALSRFKEAGRNVLDETGEQIKLRFQGGSGRKRKRSLFKTNKNTKKRKIKRIKRKSKRSKKSKKSKNFKF